MAKTTGKISRSTSRASGQSIDTRTGMWTTRNSETGIFTRAKKSGGPFKGVKREN